MCKQPRSATLADRRRAVQLLLDYDEWGNWSDGHIAKLCCVSQSFVSKVRASLKTVICEAPVERTYTIKHGIQATMQTDRIGKTSPAAAALSP
jgi:hypothetical protein